MAKNIVNQIRKATRRKFSAEQKIRIVLEGLRGEIPVSELARREGIAPLERLGREFAELRRQIEQHCEIFASQDILLRGAVQDEKKLVAARALRSFLRRLEKIPAASGRAVQSPKGQLPVWIGNTAAVGGGGGQPWELPLGIAGHTFISGKTGSGKSFAARAVCEGAASHASPAILVLDPRDQWVGMLRPEDRPKILGRYQQFGLKPAQARSFRFTYHGVGRKLAEELPENLGKLARGRHIVSFKGMDDAARCDLFADILGAVFEASTSRESDIPRTVVILEQVPVFMKKGVVPEARAAAQRSEQGIDRIAREGRKYGLSLVLIGQSSKDLSHGMATVRQNISTRIFLTNSDRELEYVGDWLEDPKAIMSLPPGEAFVCNPQWGAVRIKIRPPLSKVWEPSDEETRRLLGGPANASHCHLSKDAQAVLELACKRHDKDSQPIRYATVLEELEITSQRKAQQIMTELEGSSAASFEPLPQRGRPLVVVPSSKEGLLSGRPEEDAEGNGE